jgi:short-subunit dehydrogenase
MEIKNKVAIVTGASSGIGEATVKLLSQKGARVVLVARSKEKLEKLSKELSESYVVVADMSKEDDVRLMVKKVIDHFGRVDILVNNAGRGYDANIEEIDPQKFKELFALNILGPLVAMQEVIPLMRKQGGGAIINISSGTALMNLPHISAYSSLKRALIGLSLAAREELKDSGITVSVVYPFITATQFGINKVGLRKGEGQDYTKIPNADSAEHVASKIVEAIETENPEVFAHEWMGKK